MSLEDFWLKITNWLRAHKLSRVADHFPQVDDEGLIYHDIDSAAGESTSPNNQIVVKSVQAVNKTQSLEKLQEGFNKLIEQLDGINEHLDQQVIQQESLVNRIDMLPRLMESFPDIIENQKQLTERLLEQLNVAALKNQQFIDFVEKIPAETAKQTNVLGNINHQLAAAANADAQLAENFNRFNEILDKLDQSVVVQTGSITDLGRTFAASDRYLKYLITKQNKRFMWMVVTTIVICVVVIFILTGMIIYLKH